MTDRTGLTDRTETIDDTESANPPNPTVDADRPRNIAELPFFSGGSPISIPDEVRSGDPLMHRRHGDVPTAVTASRTVDSLWAGGLTGGAPVSLPWDIVAGLREQVANLLAQSELDRKSVV